MTRMPALRAREVVRVLERAGWHIDHVTGSHYIMRHLEKLGRVTVPYHGNRDLKRGTLTSIINQAGMTEEEFLRLR